MKDSSTADTLRIDVIGYDSGWGCANWKCEDGPYALRADQMIRRLDEIGVRTHWQGALGIKHLGNHDLLTTKQQTLPLVVEGTDRLSRAVRRSVQNGHIPVVVGGDHTSAIGTWSGATVGNKSPCNFGLIWIDAHLDSHTYETSYQGKWGGWWHGQPVTALMGHGLPQLQSIGGIGAKLLPQHVSIIGPHSVEPAEIDFAKQHNMRVYYFDEVMDRGFNVVFAEALARATQGTAGFGLSIDLDAFHPSEAPGVGSCEDKGLTAKDVLPIIKSVGRHPLFRALEIAELNPHRDINGKTALLLENIVESVFTKD